MNHLITSCAGAMAIVFALSGCGDDGRVPVVDAGLADTGATDVVVDTGPADTGPPPLSSVLEPCIEDSQCPDGFCRSALSSGFHGGYCTRPCGDRGPCETDVFNECLDIRDEGRLTCERRCLNGIDCQRDGYTCDRAPRAPFGHCVAVCTTDSECQVGGVAAICNTQSGLCVAEGTVLAGSNIGEGCAADGDCVSGDCLEEAGSLGFNGGLCLGPCILPPLYVNSSFYAGERLPQGDCGADQICFPTNSLTRTDLGACFPGCTSDADCRTAEGYGCRKTFSRRSGDYSFPNGVCLPINCATTACPSGYTCNQVPLSDGSTRSLCQPD